MPTRLVFLVLLAGFLGSCTKRQGGETDLVTFPLRGVVAGLDTARCTVTVSHDAIPNYMNAMVMPFKVRDRALLRPLSVGDTITATLAVSRTESWLEGINVAGKGDRTLSADEIMTAKIFRAGDMFPDESMVNQEGTKIRFSDYRGKVLAITFVYTRCPLPDFCIRMSNHFARIQKTLAKDTSLGMNWHLISISFDPKFDRPPVLKRYAGTYGADLATWDFATDPDTTGPALRRLADGLGLTYANDEGLIAHNLRTVLIGRDGRLVSVMKGNEWTPDEMAGEIRRMVHGGTDR